MPRKKLTIKHLNFLIKDEKEAHEEYEKLARGNPEFSKVLYKMANDEYNHRKNLLKMREVLKGRKI